MGKNKKSAASAAAQVAEQVAPEVKTEERATQNNSQVSVIQLGDLDKLAQQRATSGLDPNRVVDLLGMLNERFYRDPNVAEKNGISQENVDKINKCTAAGMVTALANEVMFAQTRFALSMRRTTLEDIVEVAKDMGVDIDTTKLLPIKEDNTKVALPIDAVKPSKEAAKKIKEEREIAEKKVELDPTKIENEEQLKATLMNILVKGNVSDRFYDKVHDAIEFYRSYLSIKAAKSDNKDEQLKAIKSKSQGELLSNIADLLGKLTFTIGSMAKFMYEATERSQSPVAAFCMFRDASLNKKTGMPQIEDQLVADIVKVLIQWYAKSEIQERENIIKGFEKDIETLKKDEKKNKKGIETGTTKIENIKKQIAEISKISEYVNIPSRTIVDEFPNNYTDNKAEGFKMARMIGSKIMKTYYGDSKPKDIKMESLVYNLHQYMGVITNMFLPPLNKMPEFNEANFTEFEKIESEKKA